jgi:hypothetical protein
VSENGEPGGGRRVAATWLIAVAVLAAATLVADKAYSPPSATAIPWKQQELSSQRPEVILLGNSMLGEGIDEGLFESLTGLRTCKWAIGGSESAYWYVVTKNVIATCAHKPRLLVVFFRGTVLAYPGFRTSGKYRDEIELWTLPEEPLLDELAYRTSSPPLVRVAEQLWPLCDWRHRNALKTRAETLVKQVTAALLKTNPETLAAAAAAVFAEDELDLVQATAQQLAAEQAFSVVPRQIQIGRSFLPEIVRVTKEAGIQLVFVRVKRRTDADGRPQSAELTDYINGLREYLQEASVPLLDFSHDPSLGLELFAAGDHLDREKGRPVFTRLVAAEVGLLLPSE